MTTDNLPVYSAQAVAKLFQLRMDENVLKQFAEVPAASPRRIQVWHPGLSLMEQAELPLVRERKLLYVRPDFRTRDFATAKPRAGYYPVCLPAPDTERKTAEKQEGIVAPFHETACPVAIATWTWLVHKVATGESLGRGVWVRCAEPVSPDDRVALLAYADGVFVYGGWDGYRYDNVRLASLGTS